MLKSRFSVRLARLEQKYNVGPMRVPESRVEISDAGIPLGIRAADPDEPGDLAAEVEVLEQRKAELEGRAG